MRNRQKTADTIVANLRSLMRATGLTKQELAKRSGVSDRMIGYILAKEKVPTVEVADALAQAFGVTGWQLLFPDLPADLAKNGIIERLVHDYADSSPQGQDYIFMVAEREAGFSKK